MAIDNIIPSDQSVVKQSPYSGRIIFDHLGKTGGTAVASWLRETLGTGTVTQNLNDKHSELILRYGGLYPIICAHIEFDTKPDPRYKYITLLRDPVDRVLSWLFFVENTIADTEDDYLGARAFLESEGQIISSKIKVHISNLYVRHFSFINSLNLAASNDVDLAFSAIREFDIIGIYEKLSRFLTDVSNLIGLQAPGFIPRVNATKHRLQIDQISQKLRERIIEINQLDLEFYYKVMELKENEWKREVTTQQSNSIISPWSKYNLPDSKIICTGDILISDPKLNRHNVDQGGLLRLDVPYLVSREIKELEITVCFIDQYNKLSFEVNSTSSEQLQTNIRPGQYRVFCWVIADFPLGIYTISLAFIERTPLDSNILFRTDNAGKFRVNRTLQFYSDGYVDVPATLSVVTEANKCAVIESPSGKIEINDSLSTWKTEEVKSISVTVHNDSTQNWKGYIFRPVFLSYHWLNPMTDEKIATEELRTPLPQNGIPPSSSAVVSMKIKSPNEPSNYTLIFTLVQEMTNWFEDIGFEPTKADIVVT